MPATEWTYDGLLDWGDPEESFKLKPFGTVFDPIIEAISERAHVVGADAWITYYGLDEWYLNEPYYTMQKIEQIITQLVPKFHNNSIEYHGATSISSLENWTLNGLFEYLGYNSWISTAFEDQSSSSEDPGTFFDWALQVYNILNNLIHVEYSNCDIVERTAHYQWSKVAYPSSSGVSWASTISIFNSTSWSTVAIDANSRGYLTYYNEYGDRYRIEGRKRQDVFELKSGETLYYRLADYYAAASSFGSHDDDDFVAVDILTHYGWFNVRYGESEAQTHNYEYFEDSMIPVSSDPDSAPNNTLNNVCTDDFNWVCEFDCPNGFSFQSP